MLPDENSQAGPAAIISATPAVESQVPGQAAAPASPQQEPPKEVPITEEKVRQIAISEAQRFAAKGDNAIRVEIQKRFESLEQNKDILKLSPEQMEQAKKDIVADVFAKPPTPEGEAPPAGVEKLHPMVEAAIGMMNAGKVTVEEGDPEFETFIKPVLSGPMIGYELLHQTALAMEAKKQRLLSNSQLATLRTPSGPAGGGASSTPKTAEEKISEGLRKADWPTQEPPPKKR